MSLVEEIIPGEHLLPEVRKTLDWSIEERVKHIWSDTFIDYPGGNEAIARIEELRSRPRALRPQNLLVTGPAGMGKTAIAREYLTLNPKFSTPDVEIQHVIMITAHNPGEGNILSSLLQQLGYAKDWEKGTVIVKLSRVYNALKKCQVQIIIVDEIHNFISGGKKSWDSLRVLKNLSNELKIPIIFFGNEDAIEVLRQDTQLTTRVDVVELPLWIESQDLCDFLFALEKTLSLKYPSFLYKKEKMHLLIEISGALDPFGRKGILSNVIKLVKTAAEFAVRQQVEEITTDLLRKAGEKYSSKLNRPRA